MWAASAPAGAEHGPTPTKRYERTHTLVVLCAASAIKGADLQMLPASFRAMEMDLGWMPYELGLLALSQGVACAAAGPVWANLVDCGTSRGKLMFIGMAMWGVFTLLLGTVTTFHKMAVLRALNGVALAMLLPVQQSFVVDLAESGERGYIFGWLYFFSNMGQVLSCLFVTPLSTKEVFGLQGWRVALMFVGVASLFAALLVPLLVKEPPRVWRPERMGVQREFGKLMCFLAIPTFCVILVQGVFGTIPGAALSFTTMYFQYTGISDTMVALINALRILGDALGGLLGGIIGDAMHAWSPRYGRPMAAQISVIACVPLVYLIFLALPRTEESWASYAGLLLLHGVVGSWVAPGCLCPVMCDIIPKRCLASAYAWELAIVFASGSSLGPLLVGSMSQMLFGYRLGSEQVEDLPASVRMQNAEALGLSVLFTTAVPYTLCALLMSLMYFTYGPDVQAAQSSENFAEGEESEAAPLVTANAARSPARAARQ